jgi:hypothetical protein
MTCAEAARYASKRASKAGVNAGCSLLMPGANVTSQSPDQSGRAWIEAQVEPGSDGWACAPANHAETAIDASAAPAITERFLIDSPTDFFRHRSAESSLREPEAFI